jgi:hypothetical protein
MFSWIRRSLKKVCFPTIFNKLRKRKRKYFSFFKNMNSTTMLWPQPKYEKNRRILERISWYGGHSHRPGMLDCFSRKFKFLQISGSKKLCIYSFRNLQKQWKANRESLLTFSRNFSNLQFDFEGIGFDDFCNIVTKESALSDKELEDAFNTIDVNHDEFISFDELYATLTKVTNSSIWSARMGDSKSSDWNRKATWPKTRSMRF